MATSEEVAQLAGVSRATVSRALNGSARVSDDARERVHAAIAELGYEPDVVAQSLVRQRSRAIVVSLFAESYDLPLSHFGQTSQYFYLGVLENIEREAVSLSYDLLLPSRSHSKSPGNYVRHLQTRRVAGCILLHASDARVHDLIHSSIPTVFIDKMGQGSHATYIKSDNIAGARQATEHLLALGHRRIAFLTGSTVDLAGLERLLGCQQTLAQAGIAPDAGLVRQSGWNVEDAYEAAMLLLAERRDFTAIVAGSDFMAIGILRALTEQGRKGKNKYKHVLNNNNEEGSEGEEILGCMAVNSADNHMEENDDDNDHDNKPNNKEIEFKSISENNTNTEGILTGYVEVHVGVLFCKAWMQLTYVLSKEDLVFYRSGASYRKHIKLSNIESVDMKSNKPGTVVINSSDAGIVSVRMENLDEMRQFVNALHNRKYSFIDGRK